MGRYKQTLARVGLGLAALAGLAWLLWPEDYGAILNPEPLFTFATALVVWVFAEIKWSEEVQQRGSSPNDIRLAKMLLQYHAEQFRIALRDHDYHRPINPRYLSELDMLAHYANNRHTQFQKKALKDDYEVFIAKLDDFLLSIAKLTAHYRFPAGLLASVRPPEQMDDFFISDRHKCEISTLNNKATEVWRALDKLVGKIKKEIPESLDETLQVEWLTKREE